MNLSMNVLESPGRVLTGFNGSTTISLNEIVLPLSTGPIIVIVKFSVVEDPSPYNAILGRAWIQDMKAIPSMYH